MHRELYCSSFFMVIFLQMYQSAWMIELSHLSDAPAVAAALIGQTLGHIVVRGAV